MLSPMLSLPREILPAFCPDPGVAAIMSRVCRDFAHLADAFEIRLGGYYILAQSRFHSTLVVFQNISGPAAEYIISHVHETNTYYYPVNNLFWLPAILSSRMCNHAHIRDQMRVYAHVNPRDIARAPSYLAKDIARAPREHSNDTKDKNAPTRAPSLVVRATSGALAGFGIFYTCVTDPVDVMVAHAAGSGGLYAQIYPV